MAEEIAPSDNQNSRLRKAISRFWLTTLILVLAGMLIDHVYHRTTLVNQIPATWNNLGIISGGLLGCAFSYWIAISGATNLARWRKYLAIGSGPFILAALGSYVALLAYEFEAFSGYAATPSTAIISVTDKSSRHGFSATAHAVEGFGGDQEHPRDVFFDTTDTVYEYIEPYRHPGRDCFSAPTEIGRNGTRRYRLDRPISANDLVKCPD